MDPFSLLYEKHSSEGQAKVKWKKSKMGSDAGVSQNQPITYHKK